MKALERAFWLVGCAVVWLVGMHQGAQSEAAVKFYKCWNHWEGIPTSGKVQQCLHTLEKK